MLEKLKKVFMNSKNNHKVETSLGTFILDEYNFFECEIDYLKDKCKISIRVKDENENISNQVSTIQKIIKNIEEFDNKVKNYVADTTLDDINNWYAEEEKLTRDRYINYLEVRKIIFWDYSRLEVELYMNDESDILGGHCLVVRMSSSGEFIETTIEG